MKVDFSCWVDRHQHTIAPNEIQAWAMRTAFRSDVTDMFVTGGFRAGKTLLLGNVAGAIMGFNRQAGPGAKYGIASNRISQLKAVTMPSFDAVINAATGWHGTLKTNPLVWEWDGMHRRCVTALGELVWGSGHDGLESFEGHEFTAIFTDESVLFHPTAQHRLRERLSQKGYPVRVLFNVATPQPGRSLPFIMDRYKDLQPGVPERGLCTVAMPTILNTPHLADGYIDGIMRMYSSAMVRALLWGEFVLLGSRTVRDYGDGSIIEYAFDPNRPVELWWDPGAHRPAFLAVQEERAGSDTWVIFDELMLWDVDTEQQAHEVLHMPWAPNITEVVPDPSAGQRRAEAVGMRSNEKILTDAIYAKFGRRPQVWKPQHPEDRMIEVGVERLNGMILAANGDRRLKVARRLAGREYGKCNSGKPVIGIHRSFSEQPTDKDLPDRRGDWDYWSHPMDAARYGAVRHSLVVRIERTAFDGRTTKKAAPTEQPRVRNVRRITM